MGIDVYLLWDNMSEEEKASQLTGFNIHSGHRGYLREAYHGGPYATHELVTEDWDDQPWNEEHGDEHEMPGCGFVIPNSVLQDRKELVMATAKARHLRLYDDTTEGDAEKAAKSFADFIELHRQKEEDGKNPRIYVSY